MNRRPLIIIGPLPPPYHGVSVSTGLVLANPVLDEIFSVEHLDTSDHRVGRNIGTWDLPNLTLGLTAVGRLAIKLRARRGVVYLPLSQSTGGFLRDSLFIHLAARCGWKVAVHLRGSDFRRFYELLAPPLRFWARITLHRVDSAAVMGSSLRWVFEGLVPSERIAAIPNGTPTPNTNGIRRDPETVLFFSNLRRRKGVIESLETAKLVLREWPDARFVFVGDWEDRDLEAKATSLAAACGGNITFQAGVSGREKDVLLASSSILLFPPVEPEGHPRVVLEGLAAGLPVVTTDRGAIRETVQDGTTGFVLDDPNPEELADRILRLLRDPELLGRMREAARADHRANYSQEVADRRLAEWLGELARSGERTS